MPASTVKKFNSQCKVINTFADGLKNDCIKNEPMFFNADFNFAMEKGGDITRAFLNALPMDWKQAPLVFDSRVHMLMPEWFPCIPGWHHDDVPRTEKTDNQPDYDNPKYKSEHILGLVNADICPTLFALGECEMPAVKEGDIIYEKWDAEVQALVKNEQMHLHYCADRTLYFFDWQTFHTGTKAASNGWRWFGRVSRNTDRVHTVTNEIRVNAQVYLENPNKGW